MGLGKRFLNSEGGTKFVQGLRKNNPDGFIKTAIMEQDSKGRLQQVGERKTHINEVISMEEKK